MQTGLYYTTFSARLCYGPYNLVFFKLNLGDRPVRFLPAGLCFFQPMPKKKGAPKPESAFGLTCNLKTDAKL